MRILNVIKIKDGVVDDMESYGIFDEQLSDGVVKEAQNMFIKCAEELGFCGDDEEDVQMLLDDGYFENRGQQRSVCLTWSEILWL